MERKKYGAFRGIPARRIYGVFRDIHYARTGETPCIQQRHFGVVIARVRCNPKDSGKASGTAETWTQSHTTRLAAFSPALRRIDLQRYGSWRSFQQPLLRRLEIQKCLDFYTPIGIFFIIPLSPGRGPWKKWFLESAESRTDENKPTVDADEIRAKVEDAPPRRARSGGEGFRRGLRRGL